MTFLKSRGQTNTMLKNHTYFDVIWNSEHHRESPVGWYVISLSSFDCHCAIPTTYLALVSSFLVAVKYLPKSKQSSSLVCGVVSHLTLMPLALCSSSINVCSVRFAPPIITDTPSSISTMVYGETKVRPIVPKTIVGWSSVKDYELRDLVKVSILIVSNVYNVGRYKETN